MCFCSKGPVILPIKVLEVSSPTAGSALLGPSQMQSLLAAHELTLRTMSAHGESSDSLPVHVPSKLASIMAGPAATAPQPHHLSHLPSPPSYGNSAAKVSMPPSALPSDTNIPGHAVGAVANPPRAPHPDDLLLSAAYVNAWANPSSAAALADREATLPVATSIPLEVILTLPSSFISPEVFRC